MRKFAALLLSLILVFTVMQAAVPATAEYIAAPQQSDDPLLSVELLSDTHIGSGEAGSVLQRCIGTLNSTAESTDGVIIAGDLTNSGTAGEHTEFYNIIGGYTGNKIITAGGNHDYRDSSGKYGLDRNPVRYRNDYFGITTEKDYYSCDINGYKVVVLGDESLHPSNGCYISDEQIAFLKSELDEGAKDGRPAFVVSHWPLKGTNGEALLWPIIGGGCIKRDASNKIKSVLSQYQNIFFISGHTHMGFPGNIWRLFGINCVERKNGIICISVPSAGKGSRLGVRAKGAGMHLTLTENSVTVQGCNFMTGETYGRYTYTYDLSAFTPPEVIPEPDLPPEGGEDTPGDSPAPVYIPDDTAVPEEAPDYTAPDEIIAA